MTSEPNRGAAGVISAALIKDARKIVGFVVIGGACAALYTLICVVFTQNLHWPVWAATVFAYALVVPANYLAQKVLAFQSAHAHAIALPRYLATHVGNMCLAAVASEVLSRVSGLSPVGVFLATAALVSVISYILLDRWVFGQHTRFAGTLDRANVGRPEQER